MDGWHHKSITQAVTQLQSITKSNHINMDWQENAKYINKDYLAKFDAVVFLLTTGEILTVEQQTALQQFIQSGKGFVGIHSAADTLYNWPWYGKLIGHRFVIHPQIQTAKLTVLDPTFPGLEGQPSSFWWTEEWYEFGPSLNPNLHYLLAVDESTYQPEVTWGEVSGKGMGEFHPIAWCHNFDGGRVFYTGLGHIADSYQQPWFKQHIFGGLLWAATGKGSNCPKPGSTAD